MALYTQTGSLQTYGAVEAAGPGVLVPDAQLLFTGDYSRAGSDLVLTGSDGAKFLVTGYFNTDTPPSLVSPDGAKLPSDVVMSLAGPQFPGQYAQAGDAANGKAAIGKVESSSGSASAVRADGTTQILKAGDPVFQGDVVLTGPASKLGISFVDGTIFSLSANARMVLNSLVYDPDAGQNNSMLFSLVEGSFVFAAGQIAPTGDMKIQTPVATMGIRGTAPTVTIDSETGEVNFSIIADPGDGHVGTYTLYNLDNGLPIGTVSSIGTKWQLKSANGQIIELDKSDTDLLNDANAVGQINTIYSQWQNSTQQNPDGPQAGPENNGPPSGGLNTNPQNPDAPGADGNTGGQGNEGEGDGQPAPQGNEQQSSAPPPPPATDTGNDLPPPPPPTEASGPNFIFGTPGIDDLDGTEGDDVIDGLEDDDTINALGGDDVIIIGPESGVDNIDGGEGTDTVRIEGGLDIDTETFESTVDNIEIVDLNKTDENTLTISADDINGLNENKTLQIRGGNNADETTDTLNLTSTFFDGDEELVEGVWQQVQDELRVIDGISFDVFEFVDDEDNVLATAEVERGIDVTLGETVIGTNESEELQGGEGFDIINALGGDDTIIGGSGEGDDDYDGGEGDDTIIYSSTSDGIVINLVDGTVNGSEIGFDTIVRLENFVAGSGNDTLIIGEDSAIFFDGSAGTDTIEFAGDLDIDADTTLIEAENVEIIDLNHTGENTFTISADGILGANDDKVLQIRGGPGNDNGPRDTLNLTSDFYTDNGDGNFVVGAWQLSETQHVENEGTEDEIIFDVYEFKDSEGNVLVTAQVEQGIDVVLGQTIVAEGRGSEGPANVGYYDTTDGQGDSSQAAPIQAAGHNAINITVPNAAALQGLDVLFLQVESNSSYGTEFLNNLAAIHQAVAAGMTLIIHDRFVSNAESILPGSDGFNIVRNFNDSSNIDVLDTDTSVTDGPGGQINDSTLDGGNASSHGFAVEGSLPEGAELILSTGNDSNIVTFSYAFGEGNVIYSTIPLDFYLDGFGPSQVSSNFSDIYAPNVVDYGAELSQDVASTLIGGPGDDIIIGDQFDNILIGNEGGDTLVGNGGNDTLTGGAGANEFVFHSLADGLDTITDFGDQDTLDLTGLLDTFFDPDDPANDNIDNFVQATTNGNDTTISVDLDGTGIVHDFIDIAVLQGVMAGDAIKVTIGDEDTFVTSVV